jgi:hypothetical protein
MIKPIIKNWIKYFATTLALSGMLVVGGCDTDNRQQDADYENQVEAAETEIGEPTREDVRQDVDAETYDMDDREEQSAQEANETEQANQTQDTQYERMNNRANQGSGTATPRAEGINDMDNHLEEHSDANKEATQTLTDRELEEAETTGIYEGDRMSADQQEANRTTENGQATTDHESQATDLHQETRTRNQDDGTTQQNNRLDQSEDANIGRQGTTTQQGQEDATMQQDQQGTTQQGMYQDRGTQQDADDRRQGGVPEEGRTQGTDSQVEYETDRQGTTEMEIDRQNQGNTNQQGQEDTDTNAPIQETQQGDDVRRQGGTNLQGMEERHEGTDTDQQGTQQQDQQGTMQQDRTGQEDESAGVIIYERYSVEYPEDSYTEEDRQRMDDIMGEYEDRRERMRGQMDTETGAYASPEEDAQPQQGYDQLMNQIQENLDYPQDAQAAEIEGTVFVNFIVDEDGNITEAKAVDDVIVPVASTDTSDPLNPTNFSENEIEEVRKEMRKEAVEAVEVTSGQWEPGKQGGENVKSELQIPVRFNLADRTGTGVR